MIQITPLKTNKNKASGQNIAGKKVKVQFLTKPDSMINIACEDSSVEAKAVYDTKTWAAKTKKAE